MPWGSVVVAVIVTAGMGWMLWQIARMCQGHIVVSPTVSDGEPWQVHFARLGVGAVSGMVVALVKYAGDDSELTTHLISGDVFWLLARFVGYAFVPIFLGAIGGWISDERKVHKIFWVAISAPIIIAAAAGGHLAGQKPPETLPVGKAGWNFEQFLPVSPAYGSEAHAAEHHAANESSDNAFVEGMKLFWGQRDQARYRVVIHSVEDDREKADAIAARINKEFAKQLPVPATVGDRKPFNRYWPIVLDGWTTYSEAKKLKDSISDLDFRLDDKPYISVKDR